MTDAQALIAFSRQLVKALRQIVLPVRKRVTNHEEHIKWLLAKVKQLQRDRESDHAEIERLRERLEKGDAE